MNKQTRFKWSEILNTTTVEAEDAQVHLNLAPNVKSLEQIRKLHDQFLQKFVTILTGRAVHIDGSLWWISLRIIVICILTLTLINLVFRWENDLAQNKKKLERMNNLSETIKPFLLSHRQHQLEDTKRLKSSPDNDSQQFLTSANLQISNEMPRVGLQIFQSISGSTSHDDYSHGVAESDSYSPEKTLVIIIIYQRIFSNVSILLLELSGISRIPPWLRWRWFQERIEDSALILLAQWAKFWNSSYKLKWLLRWWFISGQFR